jgi:UDP-N-acetylmuramate dehydrogenase
MQKMMHVNLARYTSFGTGGPAETFIRVEKTTELFEVLSNAKHPVWVLGSGTNVLVSDKGLPGTTIHLETRDVSIAHDDGLTIAVADAGIEWDILVQKSIAENKWGLERMSGVPGTVGAAVVGNIAAYGQAVADSLLWVEALDLKNPQAGTTRLPAEVLGLKYRFSDFQTERYENFIIINAAFALSDEPEALEYASALKAAHALNLDPDDLKQRREIILEARRRIGSLLDDTTKHLKTAGSFFRNPLVKPEQAEQVMQYEERGINYAQIKKQNLMHGGSETRVSAAHVLLAAGFHRGQSWGPVRLHPDHILKIENTGNATSQQIYDVAQEIIQTVKSKLGITLEPEVRFLGEFDG